MIQPPARLRLVALTANLVDAPTSASLVPDGNVKLLLIMKSDSTPKISAEIFNQLIDSELDHLAADPTIVIDAKSFVRPERPAKPIHSALK